jgi:MATE family, multidrug efflux pump
VKFGMFIMAALAAALFFFPDVALGLFVRSSELGEAGKAAAIEAGSTPLRLMAAASTVLAAAVVFTQSLYGAGNTTFVMIVEGTLHLSCLVPLAWLFGIVLDGGLAGVWCAACLYVVLLALIMGWKWRQGTWAKIVI